MWFRWGKSGHCLELANVETGFSEDKVYTDGQYKVFPLWPGTLTSLSAEPFALKFSSALAWNEIDFVYKVGIVVMDIVRVEWWWYG